MGLHPGALPDPRGRRHRLDRRDKAHYYGSHRNINPTGFIPIGPGLDFTTAHGRAAAFPRRDNNTASVTPLHSHEEDSTVEVPTFKQTGSAGE
jgi:hypothetical protein